MFEVSMYSIISARKIEVDLRFVVSISEQFNFII